MKYYKELSIQKKRILLLYTSTLVGTLLGVMASVINTRFLNPIEYGDVRYVQNIINFMASLLLFGYFLSGSRLLALSDSKEKSRKIRGCLILVLIVASILLFLGTFVNYYFHSDRPDLANLFLVSLPVCLYPLLNNYINNTAQGDSHIGRLAVSRSIPSLLYIPIAFLLYNFYGATPSRMILLQWGIYSLVLVLVIISTMPIFENIKKVFLELNVENKEYGIQLYYGSLIMIGTNYIAGITLSLFNENNANVGFYTLALTVTNPLAMLPAIIGTTYFKQFARQERIPIKVIKATLALTIVSCILFILLIHPLVKFLYTDTYRMVGMYASWMAVGFSIHGMGDMINRYLGSHGQGVQIRNASILSGFIKLIGFTLFVYIWNVNGAILSNVLASVVYCLVLYFYYIKFTKKSNI